MYWGNETNGMCSSVAKEDTPSSISGSWSYSRGRVVSSFSNLNDALNSMIFGDFIPDDCCIDANDDISDVPLRQKGGADDWLMQKPVFHHGLSCNSNVGLYLLCSLKTYVYLTIPTYGNMRYILT